MAQDVRLYDWPDAEHPLLIESADGLLFLHADGRPGRAYAWRGNSGKNNPRVIVTDMDRNGGPEVIGAGKPTFMLGTNADPVWFNDKGCAHVAIADVVADTKLDVVCVNGRDVKVYTHDNQFAWGITLPRAVDTCRVGDLNGDAKADLECQYKGGKTMARLDASGKPIDLDAKEYQIPEDATPYSAWPTTGTTMSGAQASVTLRGAEASVQHDGGKLLISTSGPVIAIDSKDAPQLIHVVKLGPEKQEHVVAITKKELIVISADGKRVERSPLAASRYKRKPLAELRTIYANGFADSAAAQESVRALQAPLSACYASQAKQGSFTGSGQLILTVRVSADGKIAGVDRVHSEIADARVVKCAMDTLKKVKPPATVEGRDATMNITMTFTFRDQP
jgi:hypothetical protein